MDRNHNRIFAIGRYDVSDRKWCDRCHSCKKAAGTVEAETVAAGIAELEMSSAIEAQAAETAGIAEIEVGSNVNTLITSEVEEYAFDAIKGSKKSDYVVLGKYEDGLSTSYDVIAEEIDAQYFNLDNWDELSSIYSRDEI